jgi:hypothetical protein
MACEETNSKDIGFPLQIEMYTFNKYRVLIMNLFPDFFFGFHQPRYNATIIANINTTNRLKLRVCSCRIIPGKVPQNHSNLLVMNVTFPRIIGPKR